MITHSSILAWRIPWTEEPGRLQPTGLQRVGHNWATSLSTFPPLRPRHVTWGVLVPQPGLDPNEESEPLDPGEVPWVSLTLGLGPFLSLIGLTASHPPSVRYLSLTEFYPLFLLRGDNSQLFRILAVSCFWASSKIGIPWTDEKVCLFTENLTYWCIFSLNLIGWSSWY